MNPTDIFKYQNIPIIEFWNQIHNNEGGTFWFYSKGKLFLRLKYKEFIIIGKYDINLKDLPEAKKEELKNWINKIITDSILETNEKMYFKSEF